MFVVPGPESKGAFSFRYAPSENAKGDTSAERKKRDKGVVNVTRAGVKVPDEAQGVAAEYVNQGFLDEVEKLPAKEEVKEPIKGQPYQSGNAS